MPPVNNKPIAVRISTKAVLKLHFLSCNMTIFVMSGLYLKLVVVNFPDENEPMGLVKRVKMANHEI
jgi:hypothetical protein